MAFDFEISAIPEVVLIKSTISRDERGFFLESYKKSEFDDNGIPWEFKQDNISFSRKNVLRGMHFQIPPYTQGKLVRVISGRIFDVAVDLRRKSRYFKKWVGFELSPSGGEMLWIPPGFAHGFYAIEDSTVHYKVTAEYNREMESGIRWNDPIISIDWGDIEPIVSEKDKKLPLITGLDNPFL